LKLKASLLNTGGVLGLGGFEDDIYI